MSREHISAFADGEFAGATLTAALEVLETREGRASWTLYHHIGDALRSDDLAGNVSADFAARLASRLEAEPVLHVGAAAHKVIDEASARARATTAGDNGGHADAGAQPAGKGKAVGARRREAKPQAPRIEEDNMALPVRRRTLGGAWQSGGRGQAARAQGGPMFPILRGLLQGGADPVRPVQALTQLTVSFSAVGLALVLVTAAAWLAAPQFSPRMASDDAALLSANWKGLPPAAVEGASTRRPAVATAAAEDEGRARSADRFADYLLAHQEFSPSPYHAAQYVRSVPLSADGSR